MKGYIIKYAHRLLLCNRGKRNNFFISAILRDDECEINETEKLRSLTPKMVLVRSEVI